MRPQWKWKLIGSENKSGRGFILALLLGLFLCSNLASAQSRVVVGDIKGKNSDYFLDEVSDITSEFATIIPPRTYRRAKKQVKRFRETAKSYAALAIKIDADGFLSGFVKKKGRGYELVLEVRQGLSGDYTDERITVDLKSAKLSSKEGKKLRRRIRGLISALPDLSEFVDTSVADPAPPP